MADLSIEEPLSPWQTQLQDETKLDSQGYVDDHTDYLAMIFDGLTVATAAVLVAYIVCYGGSTHRTGVWQNLPNQAKRLSPWILLISGFAFSIVFHFERLHLYANDRIPSILQEQKLIIKACFLAGFLPTLAVLILHPLDIQGSALVGTVTLAAILLGSRRLAVRIPLYSQLRRETQTRNVFIVGTGPTAIALRDHLQNNPSLGYCFKGFVGVRGSQFCDRSIRNEVVGPIYGILDEARRHFVDEIFLTSSCDREDAQYLLERARSYGLNIRLIPDLYDAFATDPSIEFVGQFPVIPLHRKKMSRGKFLIKRALDITIAISVLIPLAPVLLVIAVLIKCDSSGPALYLADRVGRKGRSFGCFKFRTMVQNAESLRAGLIGMNQRDGVLFKVDNDPRITRIGRVLRKYSLDELPQFINVLKGEMSVVGPRPALASEVRQYKLDHLRRLDITPGITGLWQVQARKDPSFDRYISLDLTYVEKWTIWLDLEIIFRTLRVMLAGTGS
jgi:exopolysaccharide biosynthesis polyprenyl glycosylphosphotransferase